jgi:TonB family protein
MSIAGCVSPGQQKTLTQGTCWVGVWVERDGSVREAQLVKSTGNPRIDSACLNAIRGQEVAAWISIPPFRFDPVAIRRYKVVGLRWQQISRPPEVSS